MAPDDTDRRILIYTLAALAQVHLRTAERAYELGPDVIRGRMVRERVAQAMVVLELMPEGDR